MNGFVRGLIVTIIPLSLGASSGPWRDFYNEPHSEQVDLVVQKLVQDIQGCQHFSGEYPFDDKRADFLNRQRALACDNLANRRAALLSRYADDSIVVSLIEQNWCGENRCEAAPAL